MLKFAAAAALAAALSLTATAASAQDFGVKMGSHNSGYFKGFDAVLVPTYNLTLITANQATAVGGGARARNTKVLVGVDEATLRKIADEAHADLKAQFAAAGVPVGSDEAAKAAVAASGAPLQPGNKAVVNGMGGITVNKSMRQSSMTVGATAAPMLTPWAQGNAGAAGKVSGDIVKGLPQNTMIVAPTLVLDFANMEAGTQSGLRSNSASAGGSAAFTVRGVASGIFFGKGLGRGRAFPFYVRADQDFGVPTPFALTAAGAANVAPLSIMGESVARGDAVMVDLAAWEKLARAAYKSYNAAIVKAAMKGK